MDILRSTEGLKVGDLVGVSYSEPGRNRYTVAKIKRVSPAGNVWIEGEKQFFSKNARRAASPWHNDYLTSVEWARERCREQSRQDILRGKAKRALEKLDRAAILLRRWENIDEEHLEKARALLQEAESHLVDDSRKGD